MGQSIIPAISPHGMVLNSVVSMTAAVIMAGVATDSPPLTAMTCPIVAVLGNCTSIMKKWLI